MNRRQWSTFEESMLEPQKTDLNHNSFFHIHWQKKYQDNLKQMEFRQNILNLKTLSLNLINCEFIPLNRKQEIKILRI